MNTTVPTPGMTAPVGPTEDASIWRRFVGMGYEFFLLVGPVLLVGFLYGFVVGQTDHADHVKRLGLQLSVYLLIVGYFGWGWSHGRVTLPMQTLQLSVIDAKTGGPVTRGRAILRVLLATVSLLTGLWFLVPLFRRDRQTLHDMITETRLVHAPRRRPS